MSCKCFSQADITVHVLQFTHYGSLLNVPNYPLKDRDRSDQHPRCYWCRLAGSAVVRLMEVRRTDSTDCSLLCCRVGGQLFWLAGLKNTSQLDVHCIKAGSMRDILNSQICMAHTERAETAPSQHTALSCPPCRPQPLQQQQTGSHPYCAAFLS